LLSLPLGLNQASLKNKLRQDSANLLHKPAFWQDFPKLAGSVRSEAQARCNESHDKGNCIPFSC
jgi:hypothetical protein